MIIRKQLGMYIAIRYTSYLRLKIGISQEKSAIRIEYSIFKTDIRSFRNVLNLLPNLALIPIAFQSYIKYKVQDLHAAS